MTGTLWSREARPSTPAMVPRIPHGRTWLLMMILLGLLTHPKSSEAQESSPLWNLELSGTVSALSLDYRFPPPRNPEGEWVPAGTLKARVHLGSFMHLDLSYSRAGAVEGVACPLEGGCGLHPFWSQTGLLLAGAGVNRAFRNWIPFTGIAWGHFSNKEMDHPTWVWYAGVEKGLGEKVGFLLEYRVIRVRWDCGDLGWNQDVGLGLVLRVR